MRYLILFCFFLFCSFSITTDLPQANPWKLSKNKNSIKIYTRTVAKSSFKEFKATTTVDASVATIFSVIKDTKNMGKLFPNVVKAELVKTYSESSYIFYLELKAPWPVDNRDGVFKYNLSYDKNKKIGYAKGSDKSSLKTKKKGIVRITLNHANWILKQITANKTAITYQSHSNPGGSLPAWIANSSVVDFPFKTLSNLKERVKDNQYKNTTFQFMK